MPSRFIWLCHLGNNNNSSNNNNNNQDHSRDISTCCYLTILLCSYSHKNIGSKREREGENTVVNWLLTYLFAYLESVKENIFKGWSDAEKEKGVTNAVNACWSAKWCWILMWIWDRSAVLLFTRIFDWIEI